MRILEETKDYIIYYYPEPICNDYDLFRKNNIYVLEGVLIDKNTEIEYYHYEKYNDNNLNKTIIKLGKNLIKRWKNKKD